MKRVVVVLMLFSGMSAMAQVPLVYQPLNPTSVKPGSGGFVLKVFGTGFTPEAVVEWNGSARTTEYISQSHLKALINASDVAKAGTASVRVVNPGAVPSSVVFFPIRRPAPIYGFSHKLVFPDME